MCYGNNWALTIASTLRSVICYNDEDNVPVEELSSQQLLDCSTPNSNSCDSFDT